MTENIMDGSMEGNMIKLGKKYTTVSTLILTRIIQSYNDEVTIEQYTIKDQINLTYKYDRNIIATKIERADGTVVCTILNHVFTKWVAEYIKNVNECGANGLPMSKTTQCILKEIYEA